MPMPPGLPIVRAPDVDTKGAPNATFSPNCFTNRLPMVRLTDYRPHLPPVICCGGTINLGIRTVFTNGLCQQTVLDSTSCPSTQINGSPNTFSGK